MAEILNNGYHNIQNDFYCNYNLNQSFESLLFDLVLCVFSTRLLRSDILSSTAVNVALVAKPEILGISSSISVILAL